MADLTLRLQGEDNASQAFRDVGGAADNLSSTIGKSVVVWDQLAAGAKKAVEALIEFGKASVEEFTKAERANKQLALAAGELTDVFVAQAEAMEEKYAVDAEVIKQMETMLLRFGTAPADIERTTQAILNYSAATGADAVSATSALVKAVETGSGSVKSMGVHFDSTGKFGKDLALAVDELGKKFGGAAEANADTLQGRLDAAGLAFDNVKEAFGSLINDVEKKTDAIRTVTNLLKEFAERIPRAAEVMKQLSFKNLLGFGEEGQVGIDALRNAQNMVAAREAIGEGMAALRRPDEQRLADAPHEDHAVGKDKKGKKQKTAFEKLKEEMKLQDEIDEKVAEIQAKRQAKLEKDIAESNALMEKALEQQEQDAVKRQEQHARDLWKLGQIEIDAINEEKRRWEEAGDMIGGSFVDSVFMQLERLASGDATVEQVMAHLADTVLTAVGQIIGVVFQSKELGDALSGLGHLGGQGLVAAADADAQAKRDAAYEKKSGRTLEKHDGGWIEKFHSGGWPLGGDEVPAVLQTGERVLSRREVANMGGPGQVDKAAGGGGPGGMTINVRAFDVDSTKGFFENDGGRGFYNALRTGRGMLTPIFGGA